jgi:hypothetical protein
LRGLLSPNRFDDPGVGFSDGIRFIGAAAFFREEKLFRGFAGLEKERRVLPLFLADFQAVKNLKYIEIAKDEVNWSLHSSALLPGQVRAQAQEQSVLY